MGKFQTLLKLLKEDKPKFLVALDRNFCKTKISHLIPDKAYLKMRYRMNFRKRLDLKNPETFNEKLNWLKLYNRNPEYSQLVDKSGVKKYVKSACGEEFIIPTIAVWNNIEDVDFKQLPDQFVIKCTHDSGSTVVCRNKNDFDENAALKKLTKCLKRSLFYWGREWPYKNVTPRIMAEEYVQDGDTQNLNVYKFMCFNGVPKIIQVIQNDKQPNESVDYFDTDWNRLEIRQNFPNSDTPLEKPEQLSKMLEIAAKLSHGHSFIRVDLYIVNKKIKFSEFTFYSDCGMVPFIPEKWDLVLGKWISLPQK